MGRKGRIDMNKLPQDSEGTANGNFKFDLQKLTQAQLKKGDLHELRRIP